MKHLNRADLRSAQRINPSLKRYVLPLLMLVSSCAVARDRILIVTEDHPPILEQKAVALFSSRVLELTGAVVQHVAAENTKSINSESGLVILAASTDQDSFLSRLASKPLPRPPAEADGYRVSVLNVDQQRRWGFNRTLSNGQLALVYGHDSRGLLYGLGRLLRVMSVRGDHVFVTPIDEVKKPAVKDRGVYFATHFENSYEGASSETLDRYIEEMALWGFNEIHFWLDINWFPAGFWNDPESPGMRLVRKLRHIADTAHSYGLQVGAVGVANEGFRDQPPPDLRAQLVHRGAEYPRSTICPSRPGGLEMVLNDRRKVLQLLGPIDIFTYWPYDSGGCGCSLCSDKYGWTKTFLKIGPDVARVVKEQDPHARILVSTWFMNEHERGLVYKLLEQGAEWFDGIVSDTRYISEVGAIHVSDRYAKLVFPEISMFNSYGGFGTDGANPAPGRFVEQARRTTDANFGTELYSEGFYDDVNKIVWASILWDPARTPESIVQEYSHYYFGRAEQPLSRLILGLEHTWGATQLNNSDASTVASLLKLADTGRPLLPQNSDLAQSRWTALHDRAQTDDLMKTIGPDLELAKMSRAVYVDAVYVKNSTQFRSEATAFLDRVKQRHTLVNQLFDADWAYLLYFHMEKTTMPFQPEGVIGKVNWGPLIPALTSALANQDDHVMREAVVRAFRYWWWFNSLPSNYFYQS